MRWLIDGYNVMYAGGRLGPKLSREGFRRARRGFLDELAQALGPAVAAETTVVLDASVPPSDFPRVSTYRGLSVVFALGDENADARIEELIDADSNPKALTVVSSDNRIRLAASRRRCRWLSAEKYWELLDNLKEARARKPPAKPGPAGRGPASESESEDDASYWLGVFGELDQSAEIRQALTPNEQLLTDAEIEEIKREIERQR
jgi:predicted RNA-binding protein with PIN domain